VLARYCSSWLVYYPMTKAMGLSVDSRMADTASAEVNSPFAFNAPDCGAS